MIAVDENEGTPVLFVDGKDTTFIYEPHPSELRRLYVDLKHRFEGENGE